MAPAGAFGPSPGVGRRDWRSRRPVSAGRGRANCRLAQRQHQRAVPCAFGLALQHQADNKPFTNPRAKLLMRHDNVIGTMDENTSRTE